MHNERSDRPDKDTSAMENGIEGKSKDYRSAIKRWMLGIKNTKTGIKPLAQTARNFFRYRRPSVVVIHGGSDKGPNILSFGLRYRPIRRTQTARIFHFGAVIATRPLAAYQRRFLINARTQQYHCAASLI